MQSTRYKTVNTLSRPPNLYQLLALSIVLSLAIVFFTAVRNNISDLSNRTTLTILFSLSFVSLVVSTMVCCSTDPVDDLVPIYLSPQRSSVLKSLTNCLYCQSCQSYVQQTSRHCKVCGRCVQHFDHHCIWINNCIGCHNYRSFFLMIFSLTLYLAVFVSSVGTLWSEHQWTSFFTQMAISWFFLVPAVISLLPVSVLLVLHCFLTFKGLTTYQYIMGKKQRQHKAQLEMNNTHNCTDSTLPHNNRVGVEVDQVIFHPQQIDLQTLEQQGSSQNSQPEKSIASDLKPHGDNQEICQKSGTVPVAPAEDIQLKKFYANHKSLKLLIGNTIQVEQVLQVRPYVSHKRSIPRTKIILVEENKEPVN